jgi:hypothetical protein
MMPRWTYTIMLGDVWRDENLTFEKRRDVITDRLRSSTWVTHAGPDSDLAVLVEDLAETPDVEEFDALWNELYDYADTDRAWIDTVSRP